MKCNKCEFFNVQNAKFCGNCGGALNKKKTTFFVMICFVVVLFITVGVILIYNSSKFDDPFENIDKITFNNDEIKTLHQRPESSVLESIEKDFNNGYLSSDEYVMQLLYSIYDYNSLSDNYKGYSRGIEPTQLIDIAYQLIDELSYDTLASILEKYFLGHVKWNVDDNFLSDVSNKNKSFHLNYLGASENDVSKLDNVILSNNNNFLIYYTTSGANAITKSEAEFIAKSLEFAVSSIKNTFGLDFVYEPKIDDLAAATSVITFGKDNRSKAISLLKKNKINIEHIDKALPVFVIDTDSANTGIHAFYSGYMPELAELIVRYEALKEENVHYASIITSYTSPFMVVGSELSNFNNTQLVATHELSHHYEKYICGYGVYSNCESGHFTKETIANFVASSVVKLNNQDTFLNDQAVSFVEDIESSIDKIGIKYGGEKASGYGQFIFAHNYAQIVPNGENYLFDSMNSVEPLKHLYDRAAGKYDDVLLSVAKKNMTLEYDNKLLIPFDTEANRIIYPYNYKDIEATSSKVVNTIDYSSMHYYYINPRSFSVKSTLTFEGVENELFLLMFVKNGDSYEFLHSQTLNDVFTINLDDFSYYPELVIAIVNTSILENVDYSYLLNEKDENNDIFDASELDLKDYKDVIEANETFTCHSLDIDDEFKTLLQIKLAFKEEKVSDMYFKMTLQLLNYDPNDKTFLLSQQLVSGMFEVMKQSYEELFENFKIIAKESPEEYAVTFKLTDDFYKALRNSFELDGEDKYSIIRSIEKEGFACSYE